MCGQVNTEKTLTMKLALQMARELKFEKLIVTSKTGLSALKAVDISHKI